MNFISISKALFSLPNVRFLDIVKFLESYFHYGSTMDLMSIQHDLWRPPYDVQCKKLIHKARVENNHAIQKNFLSLIDTNFHQYIKPS